MSSLTSLPPEVLKLILQHVPLSHRLSSCSLVSKAFQAAATAATEQLEFKFKPLGKLRKRNSQNVLEWMSRYGQHATSLCIYWFPQPLEQLPPLSSLVDLKLFSCQVRLDPDGQPGILRSCTGLTRLDMDASFLDDCQVEWVVVDCSCLTNLQHLCVRSGCLDSLFAGLSSETLPCLQRLTHLSVENMGYDCLQQLGALTFLQSLELPLDTKIEVLDPSSVQGFVLPGSLTKLAVGCWVEAGLLSLVPTGLKHLDLEYIVWDGPEEGPGSFLSGMARLQQLTAFVLKPNDDMAWPPPGPAYSALTASSSLVELTLCNIDPPGGIWPYVFPATRTLPHLTRLKLNGDRWRSSAWGAADIRCLVCCCSRLCLVDCMPLQHGPHVSELHKLTALTHLGARFGAGDTAAVQASFGGLAGLHVLTAHVDVRAFAVAALLPLTALTALSRLQCSWLHADGTQPGREDKELNLCSMEDDKPSMGVWLQLLLRCAEEPSCQVEALHSLAQQLAGEESGPVHRAVAMQHQQQLLEQQLRSDAQQQQTGDLKQQLSQQQQQTAELQRQLQEMQGVVQQLLQRQPHLGTG